MDGSGASTISRRRLLGGAAALGAAATLLPALARSGGAQAAARTLTVALDGSPSDLDPHTANDYRSEVALRGIYENLIGLKDDKTDQYDGVIAETWESNADKSVWTFHLRAGVTFHDGSVCDAEAVRASFARMLSLGFGPALELGRFIPSADAVTAPDAKTVVFTLGKPQIFFETAMTSQYGAQIVNVKVAKANEVNKDGGHTWAQTNAAGMGTGPYALTDYQPGIQAVLERFDGYWRGWQTDNFDRIVVRVVPETETRRQLVESGEVDIIDRATPEALQALEKNADVRVDKSYSTETDYLILTVAGPLKSVAARQAMCYAFPYDDVVNGVYRGYGKRLVGPVSDVCKGHDAETFSYPTDLEKAKSLFASAGVALGTELSVIQVSGDESIKATLQLFQANLAKLGMKLKIDTVDQTAMIGTLYRDVKPEEQPNVMPNFWWPIYNDAWDHLQLQVLCAAAGTTGTNAGYYCNADVDKLMTGARDAADPAAYQAALSKVQQIVTRDDPAGVYYLQRQWTTVLRADLANFVFNPINIGTYDYWRLRRK